MNLEFNEPIGIVGSGKTGQALLELLELRGVSRSRLAIFQDVVGPEKQDVRVYSDPQLFLSDFSPRTLLVSPGYPLKKQWIVEAEKKGILISSELEFVCSLLENEKIIGVTGSLGKSTTVSLLGEAALALDSGAFVGGNLGIPLARYMSEVLTSKRTRAQWMVLELSSYQLERCRNLKLEAAVMSYFSPNHLDRYESLKSYYETKWNLVRACRGPVVLNARSQDLMEFSSTKENSRDFLRVSSDKSPLTVSELKESRLVGNHQWDNLSLAVALVKSLNWPWEKIWPRMKKFPGLAHRLELLGESNGIHFVNDSKATTMESVLSAVESIASMVEVNLGQKLWLLLGGKDKNLPWKNLNSIKNKAQLEVIVFGECREKILSDLDMKAPSFESLKDAVAFLKTRVKAKDWVLLSPGGTSLDEFKGFEDRGLKFKNWVEEYFGVLS